MIVIEQGQTFGSLQATGLFASRSHKKVWECICECGKATWVETRHLVSGRNKSCGCKRGRKRLLMDLVKEGDNIDGLIVQNLYYEGSSAIAIILCRCGNEFEKSVSSLLASQKNGYKTSCGCARRGNPQNTAITMMIYLYRHGAKKRGLAFEINREALKSLAMSNCFYCGAPPALQYGDYLNGIDRYMNNEGYIAGNCVPCCWPCNRMKGPMDGPEFIEQISRIQKFRDLQQIHQ